MSATADDTVALILAWHDALNAADATGGGWDAVKRTRPPA